MNPKKSNFIIVTVPTPIHKNKTPLTKKDLIEDPIFWIDVDYEHLKLSKEISDQTLKLFTTLEKNKELLKKKNKSFQQKQAVK